MKRLLFLAVGLLVLRGECSAQVSGNAAYSQPYGKVRPDQNERDKRLLSQSEMPPGSNTMFIDASVLINVPADEFVAVFAVSLEGVTPVECGQKMDAILNQFVGSLKALGVSSNDVFVDFIAQEKIYGYHV